MDNRKLHSQDSSSPGDSSDQNQVNKMPSRKTKAIKKIRRGAPFLQKTSQLSKKIERARKNCESKSPSPEAKTPLIRLPPAPTSKPARPLSLARPKQPGRPSAKASKDFICTICYDLIVSSVTTKCGHSFCEICLFDYLAFFAKCPSCPRRLRHSNHFGACKEMDNLVDKILRSQRDKELTTRYLSRVEENKIWNRRRQPTNLEVGASLDVQTKEYVWLVGVVKRIIIRSQNLRFLLIGFRVRPK